MLIKLVNSFSWFYLILLVTIIETEAKDDFNINFILTNECTQDAGGNVNISTKEGSTLNISASGKYHINHYDCSVGNKIVTRNAFTEPSNTGKEVVLPKITLGKNMSGLWICNFYMEKNIQLPNTVTIGNDTYIQRDCHFNVTFEDPKANKTVPLLPIITGDPYQWIYIITGIVILFGIILVQTCIIIYCKIKVKKAARIESFSLRVRDSQSNEDEKRYSATPSRKNRISNLFGRNNHKDDTCIYETLEEIRGAQPPTPPIETIPTLKRHPSETDIRKRPPIPLPKQVSDDDVTDSVRDIQRRTLKQNTTPETKPKTNKSLPPVPESPTKSEPGTKSPGVLKNLKNKPGPSVVASELDNLFKKRQNASQLSSYRSKSPGPKSSQNIPEPDQKIGKSGSFSSNLNPVTTLGKVKRSLPDIKNQRMLDTEEKPTDSQKKPTKLHPTREAPQQPAKTEPPKSGPLKKKTLPRVPVLPAANSPPQHQAMRLPLPQLPAQPQVPSEKAPRPLPDVQVPSGQVPRPLPDVQESVYEEYDEEEPVYYNSDEEWTYEPLPQYNIYSA